MTTTELKGNCRVDVTSVPNSTVYLISTGLRFTLYKETAHAYLDDAKRILDKLSEEFNGMGVEEIIGALIYTVFVDDYYGKHNEREKISKRKRT